VQVRKAVSLAGVLDLAAADADKFGTVLTDPNAPVPAGAPVPARPELAPVIAGLVGDGIAPLILGGHRDEVPDRYARAAQPLTVPLLQVLGGADDVVPRKYAVHQSAEFKEVPDVNHFDVIDPTHPAWDLVRAWLA
jgi:pimeloyl-ACP methyl ester carboxylesterase